MKRFVFVLSLVLLLALSSVRAFADEVVIINIDSAKVEFTEELGFPFIDENNRTQVPFRAALEKYGAEIDWDNETRTAIAAKDEILVKVPIGESYILKNDEKIDVDTAARIVNGRTYLPIRAVIEAFGSEVEWDGALKTVVITRVPVDAKALYFAANNKSYDWKNYDVNAKIHMSMDVADDTGSVQPFAMDMNMYMSMFMEPFKAKINASMLVPGMEEEVYMPMIEMYMTLDEKGVTQYMGIADETGEIEWIKQTMAMEMLSDYMKTDQETIARNKELTEKYTKDVKYFGKYAEEGKTLIRLEYTLSGEIYKEIFAETKELMPEAKTEEEKMALEMLEGLAALEMGDLTYIVYIDEESNEIVKMEMDLGSMLVSILSGMTDVLGIPAEEMEALNSLKAFMTMEVLNINSAKDFEIPKEALNAKEMSELLEELEAELEVEAEEEL